MTIVILWLLAACGGDETRGAEAPIPRVSVAEARLAPPVFERSFSAVLQPTRDATLAARAGGTVAERLKNPGDPVREGENILRFDRREAGASYRAAAAALADAEAALDDAKRRKNRAEALGDGLSEQDLTGAATALARAEAAWARADAQRSLAAVQLSHLSVQAPFSGYVAMVGPEVGETIAPGSPVARVVDTSALRVDLGLVDDEVGAAMRPESRFFVRTPTGEVQASVAFVAPAADPQTLTWQVRLDVPPAPGLLAGRPATIRAELAGESRGVQVPIQALRPGDRVWWVSDGTVHSADVEILREEDGTAVIDGLEAGARVVTKGFSELVDDGAVLVIGEG